MRTFIVSLSFALALIPAVSNASNLSHDRADNSGIPSRVNRRFAETLNIPNGPQASRFSVTLQSGGSLGQPNTNVPRSGFTDLLPYALPAPDQKDAGTCLYMSLTGLAEWWLAKLNPLVSRASDGPLDLSERWFINSAGDSRNTKGVAEWKTDSIYIFNNIREAALNVAYRFTMGWYKEVNDDNVVSREGEAGAQYGEQYNWIDERERAGPQRVQLPTFKRDILFTGKDISQWDVGVAPDDLVQRIKWALMRNRAPVQIIYNDFGYWHATLIMGFDDQKDTAGCQFVEKSRAYFKSKEGLKKNRETTKNLEDSVRRRGVCNSKGVFFIRDSIYPDNNQPEYVYDPSDKVRGVGRYSAKFVDLEYNFVTHLANHAIQVTVVQ